MKTLFHIMAMLLAAFVATPAAAQGNVTGDWHGTLATPTGSLRLQITIRAGADGALTGELEVPDQAPGRKRPMSMVSLVDGRLRFTVPSGNISYEGVWNASTQRFDGTFRQGAELPLVFVRGPFPASPTVPGLDGHWDGRAERNGATLNFVLRVTTGPRGTIASFDSPDQMAMNLQVSDLIRQGETIRFSLAGGATTFKGTLSGDRLNGRWSDGTETNFVRRAAGAETAAPRRPQLPQPPFPYRVEEVRIANPRAPTVTLAGTLTLPQGQGPFPAAILISGSGAQDRDETLMRHKPFAVLADHLTRRGIAVLRYDDRGTGQSTGRFAGATSADFATDANAVFAFLAARPEIDRRAIGFVGHSEGGLVGPVAARDNGAVAYLVLLAGPGVPMQDLLQAQRIAIARAQGLSEAEIARTTPLQVEMMSVAASGLDDAGVRARLGAWLTDERLRGFGVPVEQRDVLIGSMLDPWLRALLRHDPAPALRAFRGPILALNGTLDQQVLSESNLAGIRAATAGNRDVTITELPRLNHLFQTAETGGIGEYARIEETMAPVVLETVAEWILTRFGRQR